jgi:hypothetical protein
MWPALLAVLPDHYVCSSARCFFAMYHKWLLFPCMDETGVATVAAIRVQKHTTCILVCYWNAALMQSTLLRAGPAAAPQQPPSSLRPAAGLIS